MDKNRLHVVFGTRQIGVARAADHTDGEAAVDGCLPARFAAMTRGLLGGPDVVAVVCASLASAFGVVTATGISAATAVRIRVSMPRASAATAPIGPFGININDREDVRVTRHQLRGGNGVVVGKAVASGGYRIGVCRNARVWSGDWWSGDRASVRRGSRPHSHMVGSQPYQRCQ